MIYRKVDKGLFCGLAFIDMRKAFDSVNHDILLKGNATQEKS